MIPRQRGFCINFLTTKTSSTVDSLLLFQWMLLSLIDGSLWLWTHRKLRRMSQARYVWSTATTRKIYPQAFHVDACYSTTVSSIACLTTRPSASRSVCHSYCPVQLIWAKLEWCTATVMSAIPHTGQQWTCERVKVGTTAKQVHTRTNLYCWPIVENSS